MAENEDILSTLPNSLLTRILSRVPTIDAVQTRLVRSIAVDPSNTWFATGSADRTIKIWDLASGVLKLAHINRSHRTSKRPCY
ncbi:hypothetical protein P8452_72946 [Trifolium repens]|nr:hypothetical protein P8452_72946 [Trifolium repens]